MARSVQLLVEDIERLGARGLPRDEFFAELSPRLRQVVPNDASCWHTLDPTTRLLTSDAPQELIASGIFTPEEAAAAGELIVRSEYMVDDANTFAGLATKRVPVATLEQATGGAPRRSARYRDALVPAGIPHELRGAFVIRGRVWGAVHIARSEGRGAFGQQDMVALAAVAGAIGRGIRASLRFEAAQRVTGTEAPGLVVLGPGDEIELITPPAHELLAALRAGSAGASDTMPTPVLAVAGYARTTPAERHGDGSVVTVPGADGWITLHASLPGTPGDGRVAVVLERATAARSATIRLDAFGATAREREIATLLARGLSRAALAETLVLSAHTVDDHVKNLYAKVGVASRQELVARVFLDEYLPEVVRGTPLTSRGRFEQP